MLKELYRMFDNRVGRPVRRCIGFLLVSCFFLGVVTLAMHHHDVSFQLKDCAICKAKISFPGTFSKIKPDLPLLAAAENHRSGAFNFTNSPIRTNPQRPFIASRLPNPFLNKAPPALS